MKQMRHNFLITCSACVLSLSIYAQQAPVVVDVVDVVDAIDLTEQDLQAQTKHPSSMVELTPEQLEQYAFPDQQDNFESRDLTAGQIEILDNMRKAGKELIQRKLGILSINGTTTDFKAMQSLINRRMVRLDDVAVWQNLGVLFGDVLAREFNMIWVIYEDDLGASKALRWRKTDNFLFPITMLSKRAKYGEEINVAQIFDELSITVDEFKAWEMQPKLPNPIKSR